MLKADQKVNIKIKFPKQMKKQKYIGQADR